MMNEQNIRVKGIYWKAAGCLLFLYVLIGGMIVPLKSGVTQLSTTSASSGDTLAITVTGYNTHFAEAKNNRAWLKIDSAHHIQSYNVKAIDENDIVLSFAIPNAMPTNETPVAATLLIDNEIDGVIVQPNAIFITNTRTDTTASATWMASALGDFNKVQGIKFPYRNILNETIRNTFFHVALWFAMFALLFAGVYYAIQYLRTGDYTMDIKSASYTKVAILYGMMGLLTGAIWGKFTWGTYWPNDIKLNMAAVAMMMYVAYLILRGSTTDYDKRAKTSASYSIFAFLALIPLLFIIPRINDSLHPGNGGNPALGGEDLDHTLRLFFYPSIIAQILLGLWMGQLLIRYEAIKERLLSKNKINQTPIVGQSNPI